MISTDKPPAVGIQPRKALVVAKEARGKQISRSLARWHIESRSYKSLPRIREQIRKNPVDLVLADIETPGLSAEAAIQELKEVRHDAALVLLTHHNAPAPVAEFMEPGVLFCSFDDLKRADPGELIERSRRGGTRIARAEAPLARHVLLDLHDPKSGRLDARRMASYLHIPLSSLAGLTGGSVAAIHKAPAARSVQVALAPIARTISLLSGALPSSEHVRAWLNTPHPDLANQVPMNMIVNGQAEGVADMLGAAFAGQPS